MATKKSSPKTVAKKTTEAVLKSAKPAEKTATAGWDAFKPLSNFGTFPKIPTFAEIGQFSSFPKFQSFKLETDMFKGNKQFEKLTQDAAASGQDQLDALMKSSTIVAKRTEEIVKTCMEIVQESGEKGASAAKTLMSCKTLNELTDVQTRLAQAGFDDLMSNATKLSELTAKLYTEAFAPINDQVAKSIKRASDLAA